MDSGTAASIGTGVDTIILAFRGRWRIQTAIQTFKNGLYFGGGTAVSNFLISPAWTVVQPPPGAGVDGIIANIQSAMGRVQTAIQSFQAGMTQGTPGPPSLGCCRPSASPDDLAGQIGAKAAEVNTAIQTAKSTQARPFNPSISAGSRGRPARR